MAGLVPAIHVFHRADRFKQDVDARVKPVHDGGLIGKSRRAFYASAVHSIITRQPSGRRAPHTVRAGGGSGKKVA